MLSGVRMWKNFIVTYTRDKPFPLLNHPVPSFPKKIPFAIIWSCRTNAVLWIKYVCHSITMGDSLTLPAVEYKDRLICNKNAE